MRISVAGLNFIANFEGFRGTLYNDPANHCTIGYGHLVHTGPCDGASTSEQPFLAGLTHDQALELLRADAARFRDCVNTLITAPLTQNQFDALVSFAFNVGCGAFDGSNVRAAVNRRDHTGVCRALDRWVYGGGRLLPGLARRRAAECTLYNTPPEAPQEDDMKPFLAWATNLKRMYLIGPFGAAWLTHDADVEAMKRLYGDTIVALHGDTIRAIDQGST